MINLHNSRFDLNLIKSLDALLTEKNVTRAANLMHVSQSTMSGTFRRLREEFDDPLLLRRGRHYNLSPLAQTLLISARHILLQVDAMVSSRSLFDPSVDARTFRIMVSDYGVQVFLAKVVRVTQTLASNVRFDIVPISSPIDHVVGGLVDMCIIGDELYENNNNPLLRYDTLFEDRFCFIVDEHHPLDNVVTIEDLRKFPHVSTKFLGAEPPASILSVIQKRGAGKPDITVSGFSMIPSLIQGSMAVGLLPCRMLLETSAGLRRLDVDFPTPLFAKQLVWHSKFDFDPAFCWLRNIMLECASDLTR